MKRCNVEGCPNWVYGVPDKSAPSEKWYMRRTISDSTGPTYFYPTKESEEVVCEFHRKFPALNGKK